MITTLVQSSTWLHLHCMLSSNNSRQVVPTCHRHQTDVTTVTNLMQEMHLVLLYNFVLTLYIFYVFLS